MLVVDSKDCLLVCLLVLPHLHFFILIILSRCMFCMHEDLIIVPSGYLPLQTLLLLNKWSVPLKHTHCIHTFIISHTPFLIFSTCSPPNTHARTHAHRDTHTLADLVSQEGRDRQFPWKWPPCFPKCVCTADTHTHYISLSPALTISKKNVANSQTG